MTRRLYVSDVHLDPADETRLAAFASLLRARAPDTDEIYLLGDICEMWIGDDDDSALVAALATLFQSLSRTTRLFFMPGNRDFLLGATFAEQCGLTRLNDAHQLADGTLLSHGDSLCTDDAAYQQMRTLLRSADWQRDILSKSLTERRAFGAGLREQSKAANANKASNIMDVNADAVAALLSEHNATLLIHGHTHRPGRHELPGGRQRLVLGSWERCAWWATQTQTSLELHCSRLTDRH